jgi:hypothetical protein
MPDAQSQRSPTPARLSAIVQREQGTLTHDPLTLNEFFLLSSTGLAYRRCQLVRVNGKELEV